MEKEKIVDPDPFKPHDGPELVIGIVAPVGARIGLACEVLTEELKKFAYDSCEVRLSSLLHQIRSYSHLSDDSRFPSEYERIREHMKCGTELRSTTERGDVLALLAVSKIREIRQSQNRESNIDVNIPLKRTAFILRSLKHPEEIQALRLIYGRAFFVISAYMPRAGRVDSLAGVIAKSVSSSDKGAFRDKAEELIGIDEEEGNKLGQNVSDAFPLADLFVDTRSRDSLERSIARYLELFFGYPFHTPTKDEYAMFLARSAALRSADLSRQVGAAIANSDGDIVAVGCNDVPKSDGGQYWTGDHNDDRDFRRGVDSSVTSKTEILAEILKKLGNAGWLTPERAKSKVEELTQELLHGGRSPVLHDAQILNLLEYGRPIHAEMAALMDAARRGAPISGHTLYTTTFPCHMCARHIIAAGIKRVVYVEPYPKSKAGDLYSDSIVIDPPQPIPGRVQFEPFVGISPSKYMVLFEMSGKRKEKNGRIITWGKISANPRINRFVLSYLLIEENIIGKLIPSLLADKQLELFK